MKPHPLAQALVETICNRGKVCDHDLFNCSAPLLLKAKHVGPDGKPVELKLTGRWLCSPSPAAAKVRMDLQDLESLAGWNTQKVILKKWKASFTRKLNEKYSGVVVNVDLQNPRRVSATVSVSGIKT